MGQTIVLSIYSAADMVSHMDGPDYNPSPPNNISYFIIIFESICVLL
jgi:hypothetical protein